MKWFKPLLLFLAIITWTGCTSHKSDEQVGKAMGELFAAPLNALAAKLSGGDDLAYTTVSFKRKNNRWPNDYSDLTNYVAKSDGYLFLQPYDRVTFSTETNDAVKIVFIRQGRTNESTFTLSPANTTNSPYVRRTAPPPPNTQSLQSLLQGGFKAK